jgi:two-component system, chemotaxis family, chemotaxis protein CheY
MPPSVLVVDDSMLIRHAVCRFLEGHGFSVEAATNGAEALEMLGSLTPALIITDLSMPKMNGRQLIDAVKARPAIANIPIAILSTKRSNAELNADNLGDYLIFKEIDLVEQLQRVLELALGPLGMWSTVVAES